MSFRNCPTKRPEKQRFLVRWLAQGISHVRQVADIPQNLINEQTLERGCQALGDGVLIRTAEDLGLTSSPSLYKAARSVPDLNTALATNEVQNTIQQWITKHQPLLILLALEKAVSKLTPRIIEGNIEDPYRTIRVLLVLSFASFSSSGTDLLPRFGAILSCHEPHRMIEKFAGIALRGESETIQKIDSVVLSSGRWSKWSQWFIGQAQSLAPQCWGRFVASRQPGDPALWNAMWDSLLNQREDSNGK